MTLISRFTTKTVTVLQPADDLTLSATNAIMAANSYFPITYKVNMLRRVFEIAGFIWLIGTLAIIIALAILYMDRKPGCIRNYKTQDRFAGIFCGYGSGICVAA